MNSAASTGEPPNPTPADLRPWLESEAYRLGFDLVGVTTPDAPPHVSVYEEWLSAGRHAEMAYLASESARLRRADPRQILPESRSILVLATHYLSPGQALPSGGNSSGHGQIPAEGGRDPLTLESQAVDPPVRQATPPRPTGKIAAYAWGDDYHEVLIRRLRQLVAAMEARLGRSIANHCYTDTGRCWNATWRSAPAWAGLAKILA